MEIKIKLIENSLILKHTEDGLELRARHTVSLPPAKITRVPTNLIIDKVPRHIFQVNIKTEMSMTRGLLFVKPLVGDKGETYLAFYNQSPMPATIPQGHLMGHGLFLPVLQMDVKVVQEESLPAEQESKSSSTLYGDD